MKGFIRKITLILSYIIPIDPKLLVFVSYPDFGDNSFAIFRYIIKQKLFLKYRLCWLIGDRDSKDNITDKLSTWGINFENLQFRIVKRKSIRGVFYCYRARYIFNTVGIFSDIVFRQPDKRINLWHGMPIKKIYSDVPNGNITIATSEFFKPLMASGLKIPESNVFLIGQPRNDLLFYPEELSTDIKSQIEGFSTIGIWMPTFRRSMIDNQYSDGVFCDNKLVFLPFDKFEELNSILNSQNALLIIKFHPMDVLQIKDYPTYSNIMFLKNNNFKQYDLYPLLGQCNYLISDYSSVVIDFELLERPIGITINDIEDYKSSRGLNFDQLPGTIIADYRALIEFINKVNNKTLAHSSFGDKYNLYRDDKASKRLIETLKL